MDAIEPARLQRLLARHPDLKLDIFTSDELDYCDRQADTPQCLAARYAAKEAVVKALKLDGFDPLEIDIVASATAPTVVLRGTAANHAEQLRVQVQVSMTHLESIAIAVAQLIPIDRPQRTPPSRRLRRRIAGDRRS